MLAALALVAAMPSTAVTSESAGPVIDTVAGNPGGEHAPATDAAFHEPAGLAVGPDGSVFVAELYASRVRRIDPEGTVTTVAGDGLPGLSGDGGPAAQAELGRPTDVAVDSRGHVYIADLTNRRVRRIDAETGTITTVAGGGEPFGGGGFSGIGGPATEARLDPRVVAVDADDNVYVGANNRILRIDRATGILEHVGGTGAITRSGEGDGGPAVDAPIGGHSGLTVGPDGSVYLANHLENRVRRIDPAGIITTVAGLGGLSASTPDHGDGGPATEAWLALPGDVAVTDDGALYLVETHGHRVRRVDPQTGTISTVAGSGPTGGTTAGSADTEGKWAGGYAGDGGPATEALMRRPAALALAPDGGLLIADSENNRIRRLDPDGTITTVAGNGQERFSGDGVAATHAGLHLPADLAVGPDGSTYIADTASRTIRRVSTDGRITTVAGRVDDDPAWAGCDARWYPPHRRGQAGCLDGDGGPATDAALAYPRGVAVASDGTLYIADTDNHRVRRVDAATGVIDTIAGSGPPGRNNGTYAGDLGPATDARLNRPWDVAVDVDGNVLIADTGNHRVRKVDLDSGVITTVAGTGYTGEEIYVPGLGDSGKVSIGGYGGDLGPAILALLSLPTSLAVDDQGNVLIADTGNHRIRRVDTDGIITTVAGRGISIRTNDRVHSYGNAEPVEGGYSGDGGPATLADLHTPQGVAAGPDGSVWIADTVNCRVRRVDASGDIDTVAGDGSPLSHAADTWLAQRVPLSDCDVHGDGGPATEAGLSAPTAVALTETGEILIADETAHRLRRLRP